MKTLLPQRRHDLDWLRLIAIVVLLFFHTGMWFNTWGWHVKNEETTSALNYWMVWSHFWRMPLLLFISGAGTYLALRKRTPKQFAVERIKRLYIPLVFGMFVIVPPQIFYEHIGEYSSYLDFYKTVFEFVPYPNGSFSWHHLWFILYLLIYSLLLLPFLKFLRSEKSFSFKEKSFRILGTPGGMLFVPVLVIMITQFILRPYFPEETHDLTDLAFFVLYMIFFFFGMLCYSDEKIWKSIEVNRKYFLFTTIVMLLPFYTLYFHLRGLLLLPMTNESVELIFDVIGVVVGWFTVITIIAYGQQYLNRSYKWLSVFNEGLYPFYILHQTMIIVIGYYVCQLEWSIAGKYWTIILLTLIACIGMYILFIRPFNLMRLLFGMKPKTNQKPVFEAKMEEKYSGTYFSET